MKTILTKDLLHFTLPSNVFVMILLTVLRGRVADFSIIRLCLRLFQISHSLLKSVEKLFQARLAQSVERQALNLVVEGSSPSVGDSISFSPYVNKEEE